MTLQRLEQMAVQIAGDGPVVLMLHGLGGSANVFQALSHELKSDHRLIIPELPGSARSAVPLTLSFEQIADRLSAMLNVLSIERFHLVGHSLATLIGQQLALRLTDRVASLTLFGAMTEPPDGARVALRERARLVRQEGMETVIDGVVEATLSADSKTTQPAVVALVRQLLQAQPAEGYALTCEALAAASAAPVGQIRCPVLMRNGEDDVVTPPSMMHSLQDRMSDARSAVLPRCGHWTMLERPDECARAAGEFIRGIA